MAKVFKETSLSGGIRTAEWVEEAGGDALVANTLDQFADVTQTGGATLAISASTTLNGGTHSGTNTGDQTNITGNAATVTTNANLTGPITSVGNATTIADAELAAIAGLTSAADKGIQFTGVGTAATFDLTAAGKALLDDADASAQRTTLGLGSLATQSGTFSGTSSGTNTGDQTITLTGDVTGSGTGSFAATIANDAVTYAKMQDVSATDKILGRSTAGAGIVEEIACTAAGRALIDDADASAQRTTLGLVIGTDVQAYDAELAAIAGLTSAADKGIQFTGAGTAATFDLTTAGKALLDDATAADQRATLSIGAYTQSDTAPISPVNGDKWLDTTTGTEYVRYDSQWISDAPASNLTTSLTLAYRAITAILTLDSSDYTVDCTANSFTVTLPTAVGIGGRVYNIKNTGNGLITVATTSNQTIDGAASGTITLAQYACLTVQSTGANWIIL